jgi:integrase
MASIDFKFGQIRDRRVGLPEICYTLKNKSKVYLREALTAHERIAALMTPMDRESMGSKEMRDLVTDYLALGTPERKLYLQRMAAEKMGLVSAFPLRREPERPQATLQALADEWFEGKVAQGATDSMRHAMERQRLVILDFFRSAGLRTTADLKPKTANDFLAWRRNTTYNALKKGGVSASTLRHELQVLKAMAAIAARNGWLASADIWGGVEVRSIAGVDTKIVEPLTPDEQRKLLAAVAHHSAHDAILLLLVTGMRVGELATLRPESLRDGLLHLHGEAVGAAKPLTGKTAAAVRALPACKTVERIWERGNIFKTNRDGVKNALARCKMPGIHPHRLRHSFAVNKLVSETATLQMVSYQLGHSEIGITANLYGRFTPEHFKVGMEAAARERRELVEWLEEYPDFVNLGGVQ